MIKNRVTMAIVGIILISFVLGCGSLNPFSSGSEGPSNTSTSPNGDRSVTDKAIDTTVGRSKIGVPECDEVMDLIETELSNSEDDFVTKAIKATVLNRIKDGIKESVDKSPNDTVELAKTCKEFKIQFDKFKAEESNKQK